MYQHILIPTDGSELARMALMHGLFLARSMGARVTVISVERPFHMLSQHGGGFKTETAAELLEAHAATILGSAVDDAKVVGVECATMHIERENVYEAIISTAKEQACDLIVMGSHGRSGASAILLGSVTNKVLSHSTIPVLVHRGTWSSAPDASTA